MRQLHRILFFLFGLLVLATPAAAEKRVALVIGNAAYSVSLANPVNDATAVAALFRSAGFEVVNAHFNVGIAEFRQAVRRFLDEAEGADVAVVFYSGHGLQIQGTNYLIPVDAKLSSEFDVQDEAMPLERIMTAIESAKRLRLIILDASRENPFVRGMRTKGTRSIGRGLARVEPDSNTLIMYSAKPETSSIEGVVSPFAVALLKHLATPGLDIRIAFGRIRNDVLRVTANRQEPWLFGSLGGETVALVPPDGDIRHDFDLAKRARTRDALDAFIAKYHRGFEVDEARTLLGWMERDQALRRVIGGGKSYALIIGNKDYRDAAYGKLETPHTDARSVADVLTTHYGFSTELTMRNGSKKSLVLLDKPGRELLELLDDLEETIGVDDRLLIYYAGHGHFDDRTGKAYWIPVDAGRSRRSEWISADHVVSSLKGINARSILVVADSCFAGALFRSGVSVADPTDAELETSLYKDAERPSRVLIASGGTEPVLDGGGSGHSIFARKFIEALRSPLRPIFSARELHVRRLKPTVAGNVKQVPQYDWLRESGHDAGDFVFVLMQAVEASAPK
jgi:uncharacterized caspase-like protein